MLSGAFEPEEVERTFPRALLEQEGTAGVIHMLADAFELWADDEEFSGGILKVVEQLRAIAGPLS